MLSALRAKQHIKELKKIMEETNIISADEILELTKIKPSVIFEKSFNIIMLNARLARLIIRMDMKYGTDEPI